MTGSRNDPAPDASVHAVMVEIQKDMLRFLTGRLGNEEEAADVLQDFYVKVLARMGDVRDREKLRGWMRKVLETTLIDYYRAQGRKRRAEKDYLDQEGERLSGVGDQDFDLMVCMCLYKLLPALKPEQAELLWRADLVGEARESITAKLGISDGNFRVRLHRARQALRQLLDETCRTCPIHGYLDCDCDYGARLEAAIAAPI